MKWFAWQDPQAEADAAIAKLRARGVLVLTVAQDDPRLDIGFHLVTGDIQDEDLAPLEKLLPDSVYQINLRGTKLTDSGLAHLKPLAGLERLHLEKTAITDAGLAHLAGLQKLAYLNLFGDAGVTDSGLVHLAGCKSLTKLFLWETKVTAAGAAKLKEALPEISIDLGISPDAAAKGEAAKNADAKAGDAQGDDARKSGGQ